MFREATRASLKYCLYCGKEVGDNTVLCPYCGSLLSKGKELLDTLTDITCCYLDVVFCALLAS